MQNIPPQPEYPPHAYPPSTLGSQYPSQVFPQQISRSGGRVALKYGLIAGAIQSAITIVVFIISFIPANSDALYKMFPQTLLGDYLSLLTVILSLFVALLNMVVYFFAGLLATRSTGKMGTAMLACLWALLCFLFVDICTFVIGIFITLPLMQGQSGDIIILLTSNTLSFMLDLILALVLGFGAGGLGALIGRQKTATGPLS
ncbi:hypothetical protein [Ktedonobacter racemifer]|uniref:Uncharacterized protein n=1 Tax=Ktedonobacter racemifer DSM 44963 TaxID=485913 RepID=D6TCF0_KTERA|nr:hypothetical protein [Ktedonobacter racemifer]EFH89967.1 hypothetical protein Krac_11558 [Ktedonobacter racemifer DSM 44963]